MTDTEKILDLLEINNNVPALVTEDDGDVVICNQAWNTKIGKQEIGKSFYKLFDKNTSLLVKNSFIDAKAFSKIQRRNVKLKVENKDISRNLLISPFKLDSKIYFYILLYDEKNGEKFIVYPSTDDSGINIKYRDIIGDLDKVFPTTINEKKNFQYLIDIEKEPMAVKDTHHFLFTNRSFDVYYKISDPQEKLSTTIIFGEELGTKISFIEDELFVTNTLFVVEDVNYSESTLAPKGRLLFYPINKSGKTERVLVIGEVEVIKHNVDRAGETIRLQKGKVNTESEVEQFNDNPEAPKIIYDKNNFDILDVVLQSSDFIGYSLEKLKNMNITELYHPEDMQKLILTEDDKNEFVTNLFASDGSTIEFHVQRKIINWQGSEVCEETFFLNQPEEEVIKFEEIKKTIDEEKEVKANLLADKNSDSLSDFLSSLFHELLTPVNVILGFVQEIIDSIDNPTEEQEESAKIIKDNQQVLLHSMNTAIQYAQLEENKLKVHIEEFEIEKYLVDLQDSFSKVIEKKNIKVIFEDSPQQIKLKHDRSKLLAAISYFCKFAIQLTPLSNIFISFRISDNKFYTFIKDSNDGISSNLANDLIEIFNSPSINNEKSYGISPITIKLARKLNEYLSVEIREHVDSGVKSIALITSAIYETPSAVTKMSDSVSVDPSQDSDIIHDKKVDTVIEKPAHSEIVEIDNFVTEESDNIANGEVDNKIVEDIEDEKEIVTEEIATVENHFHLLSDLTKLSCLFIDDNIDTQLLFKSQMKDFNLLKVCSNFTEALPLLHKYNFDLIVVDVNLNDTYNGFDALKIIRQFENYSTTPVIATTAYSFDGDKEKFINFGFTDYLVKPLLREQLFQSLDHILV